MQSFNKVNTVEQAMILSNLNKHSQEREAAEAGAELVSLVKAAAGKVSRPPLPPSARVSSEKGEVLLRGVGTL